MVYKKFEICKLKFSSLSPKITSVVSCIGLFFQARGTGFYKTKDLSINSFFCTFLFHATKVRYCRHSSNIVINQTNYHQYS